MRKRFMIALLGGAMMVAPGLTPPARASHDWFAIGTAFRVGAAYISIAFGQPSYGYEPSYYYRYDRPIRYGGHQCSRYCFHDAGYYYHHESCPLVAVHFSNYRIDRRWAFDRYAPSYDGYGRGGGYYDDHRGGYGSYDHRGDYGYYDHRGNHGSYDRYDHGRRYQSYDSHRRNDRDYRHDSHRGNGRGRSHRHHRGCGHY